MASGPVAKEASVDEAGGQEVEQLAQSPAEGLGLGGRLVKCFAPEKVIQYSCGEAFSYGSLARGEGHWDSDADILVVMSIEGRHLAKIREMRRLCPVRFPLDLLERRPEEVEVRSRGGEPVVREALDHGEVLHG